MPDESYPIEESWIVMTSSEPQQIHDELIKINEALTDGNAIQFFVPYVTFKNYNISDKEILPKYSSLRKFLFVKLPKGQMDMLKERNKWSLAKLWYYLNHAKHPITIRDKEMQAFMAMCADSRIDCEVWSTVDDLELNEKVILKTTAFKGWEARIIERKRTKNGTSFTVGLDVVGGTMLLRIKDLKEEDIERTTSPDRKKQEYKFVEWVKTHIKTVIDHHTDASYSEAQKEEDRKTLNKVWEYRFSTVSSPTGRRHFRAMMLICAQLLKDKEGCKKMQALVEKELNEIALDPPSKRATDSWACLQVAMYIATKNPVYRDAAKEYEKKYQPKSAFLHSLIQVVRRFELNI